MSAYRDPSRPPPEVYFRYRSRLGRSSQAIGGFFYFMAALSVAVPIVFGQQNRAEGVLIGCGTGAACAAFGGVFWMLGRRRNGWIDVREDGVVIHFRSRREVIPWDDVLPPNHGAALLLPFRGREPFGLYAATEGGDLKVLGDVIRHQLAQRADETMRRAVESAGSARA